LTVVALQPPPTHFGSLVLSVKDVSVTSLKRIGRHGNGEPYFGKNAAYRFDDPNKLFGTCYCGKELDTAIAETVLHDEMPDGGQFQIRQEEFDTRFLVTFTAGSNGGMLKLANLTGPDLKRMGGDNSLSAEHPYDVTQQWGAAVNAHPSKVDGFFFISKQLNNTGHRCIRPGAQHVRRAGLYAFEPSARVDYGQATIGHRHRRPLRFWLVALQSIADDGETAHKVQFELNGQSRTLLSLEAMKMETHVAADGDAEAEAV
jgi:hypothetical protein